MISTGTIPFLASALGILLLGAGTVQATSIAIVNPSFQAQDFTTFPGYLGGANPAAIDGWAGTGGVGINGTDIGAGTPFADNGTIPDNTRAAFIQGTGSLTQNITGMVPGQNYWLQVYANSRSNGVHDIPLASVNFGGIPFVTNAPVPSVGGTAPWHKVNIPFTAPFTGGNLILSSTPATGGDSALLLDGITLIQRNANQVVIFNPSFEASGTGLAFPGYLPSVAGWTRTVGAGGNVAINTAGGPFSNGFMPEGLSHAVLQNTAALSQSLDGVAIGETYRLTLDYYGRDATGPTVEITIDGNTALTGIIPNTGGQLTLNYDFVASSTTPTLNIANLGVGADTSFLFDNVSLSLIPEPGSTVLLLLAGASCLRRRRQLP